MYAMPVTEPVWARPQKTYALLGETIQARRAATTKAASSGWGGGHGACLPKEAGHRTIGRVGSADHSSSELSYSATLSRPSNRSAKNVTLAAMPPPQ